MADALDFTCSSRYLPSEFAIEAAETAVRENPLNRPQLNSPAAALGLQPEHIAVLTTKYWKTGGVLLTVGFMEATPEDLKTRILTHMNAWSEYANIQFTYTKTDPQVRITREGSGYWSYLGTDILHVPANEPTFCLERFTMSIPESEFRRVVRHEAGHCCAMPHEHMRSSIIARIDYQKAIKYFRDTQGWSPAMTVSNVLTPLAELSLMGSPDADETSIMAYSLPGIITKDGKPIIGGKDIEAQDIEYIAKVYPKKSTPPQPPGPPATKLPTITLDLAANKGYLHNWPKGFTFSKVPVPGEVIMDQAVLNAIADDMQAALPSDATELDAAKQSSIGGVVGAVLALVAAIRSGDMTAILKATRDLLNMLLGDDSTQVVGFQQAALGQRINWANLIATLTKLLPLILGA